ncbi:rho guanine nucleotide exchange factor 7-like [Oppia nitens]|uniref:rho guanine nucleotide exchange factor 7-like n=1 Tax=Oppia nitens TaxID=1686743 RepID=UPI0023DB26C2|nr:rho guanine nucleotide exchange factor 7-like [Oppia nitens]
MDVSVNGIKLVKAVYNFKPTNNDELCFNKDDIITLTQCPTGGWWEGTLNDITGWFPANYVQPVATTDADMRNGESSHRGNSVANSCDTDAQQYRQMVFQDIEDTESAYVRDIMDTINRYLKPLQTSQILPENEINSIIRIVQEIGSVHRRFLVALNGLNSHPYKDIRIGGVFLEFAPQIKAVHLDYCANHAKFVYSIEKYKKEICHLLSTNNPSDASAGNVQLTACLSASFRRIDKYPALLQELQRYTDEGHVDRGDTQRAGFVYRELSMECLELRRRKEMELEVILGNIKNWEGPNIQMLGEIVRMDSVSIHIIPEYSEMKKDRYLVLFPQILLVLSVSTEMTSFVYEAKLKLEEAIIKTNSELIDSTNIFEITTSDDKTSKQTFIIQCPTIDDSKSWIELLNKYILHTQTLKQSFAGNTSAGAKHIHHSSESIGQRSGIHSSNSDSSSSFNIMANASQRSVVQTPPTPRSTYWTNKCLLPYPPTRMKPHSDNGAVVADKKCNLSANDDMIMLQIIESYCNRGQSRQSSDTPNVYIVDEEKLTQNNDFIQRNGETNENSLVNELRQMKMEIKSLSDALKAERRSRRKLKTFVMSALISAKK